MHQAPEMVGLVAGAVGPALAVTGMAAWVGLAVVVVVVTSAARAALEPVVVVAKDHIMTVVAIIRTQERLVWVASAVVLVVPGLAGAVQVLAALSLTMAVLLTVNDCTLSNNVAQGGNGTQGTETTYGSGAGGSGYGGAIFNKGGILAVTNATMTANSVVARNSL